MELSLNCPKCKGLMVEGFIADFGNGGNATVSHWMEGPVERTWLGSARIDRDLLLDIATYRCTGCGFLESYANPKPA
jgi:hypothetical protein